MKQKYLLLIIILFTCLFLFSTSSLALIPGDFGSAGGGPPDGVVDFEDLMIFALAYGSIPSDDNWNEVCDIYPDGVIDFEDLMIFAMNYGRRDVVSDIDVTTITYQSSMSKLVDIKTKLEEDKLQPTYYFNELTEPKKGVTGYAIDVGWHGYYEAIGYRVYRSVNGGDYSIVLDEEISGYTWYGRWDDDVSPGNTYSYYVTAYGSDWETDSSEIVTRDTFLPPCPLISPPDGSVVSDPNPVFTWNPVGVSNFPYESMHSGESGLWICDDTAGEETWWTWFDNMTTSTATYNQDGQATPLVAGHSYRWVSYAVGFDENNDLIAVSQSEYWYFGYGEPVVFDVNAYTITYQSSMSKLADIITELEEEGKLPPTYYLNEPQEIAKGITGYEIYVDWHSYYGATGYRVYRSVDGGSYSMVLDEPVSGYTWYGFWDNDVSPGSTYSYYVTAYGDFGETAPSETISRKTFLPPCSLNSPPDASVVTEPNPIFTWNPVGLTNFPYDGTIYSGETYFRVYDANTYDTFWRIWFEDMTTSTATYNQDGYATPLVSDSTYKWYACSHGYDESGNLIAVSQSEYWYFGYGEPVVFDVNAYTITYQSSMSKLADTITELEEEGKLPPTYYLNEPQELAKGVTGYEIYVDWHSYYGATGYRVYRSVDGGSYSMVLDEPASGYTWYGFWDNDVSPGSTYSYYVTAYGDFGETNPSQTVTRDTFLPPCSLISPPDGSIVTESTPTFTWNPAGVSTFPYDGTIYSGETYFRVYDANTYDTFWRIWFEDMTTSTATYNQDGYATPLVSGSTYKWYIHNYGYGENGKLIAYSSSENWYFGYGENVVFDVNAYTITYQSSMSKLADIITELEEEGKLPPTYYLNEPQEIAKGVTGYEIYVDWHSYYGATGYRVYRSVDGGSYSMVLDEPVSGYTWYGFWDNDVSPGSTYSYYVTAYGDFGETAPSETISRKTFLPPCSLNSPPDASVVTEPNPIFTWNPVGLTNFPYDGTIYSGETYFRVYDANTYDTFWRIWFEDMTTSTATYNQDGYATPLVSDSTYKWYACSHGYDESGNLIAVSQSEYWYFGYGEPVVFDVNAYTITYQSSMSKLADTITELEEEGKLPPTYYLNEPQELAKGVTGYEIYVDWHSYYGATGYRVYRSVDGGSYSMVLDEPASGYTWYGFWDNDVSPGSTYSYYVTAYGDFGETAPSETISRKTFLPPCSLNSPPDASVVTEPNPIFTWNPVGLTNFPYESTIYSGESDLWIYDDTTEEKVWHPYFDDMITSTIVYNDDSQATPLVAGHNYLWQSSGYGFDNNGRLIAMSFSENWNFVYSGGIPVPPPPTGIIEVIATAKTYNSSRMPKIILNELEEDKVSSSYYFNEPEEYKGRGTEHSISLSWAAYCETTGCGYRVYRKIDEGEYEIVFFQEAPTGYDWYEWEDNEAGPGGTYSYYVTAYGTDWETDASEIVTRDTWLPPCTLNSPPDGTLTNTNPTFSWSSGVPDFPYSSLCSGGTCMLVYDLDTSDFVWLICFDDSATSTATYNQDGQATPLIHEHRYTWHSWGYGCDENGNWIATSESEHWGFDYIGD